MSRWRRLFRAGCLVFIVLAFVPSAEAQGGPVRGAETVVVQRPDIGTFHENASLSGFDPTTGTSCGSNHFDLSPVEGQFRFSESATTTGCGELGHTLQPPDGATAFRLRFRADRVIERAEDSTGTEPPTAPPAEPTVLAPQRVYLYGPPESRISSVSYFDSSEGSSPSLVHETGPFALRPDVTYNVSWYFEDVGSTFTETFSFGSGDAFSATVSDIDIIYDPIPIMAPRVLDVASDVTAEENITTTTWGLDVPAISRGVNDTTGLRIHIGDTAPARIAGPGDEALDPDHYRSGETTEGHVLVVDPAAIAVHGAGTYVLTFETRVPLPPPPPPDPPTRIVPFALIALALPVLPGAFALRSNVDYRRRAFGPYLNTARNLLAVFAVLAALYLFVVFVVLSTHLFDALATLPLVIEAILLYGQLIVLTLLFVALAIIPGRYLVKTMQDDLERRRRVQAELERSNKELEHFAYVASHDLQEPLRTIAGFTQLLRRRYGEELDERALSYIERTVRGTDRMRRLIEDLLAYSRVRSRGKPFTVIDTGALLAEVREDIATRIEETGTTLDIGVLPVVRADPSQLRQVFANLVQNAIRHRDSDRPVTIRIEAEEQEDAWCFTVGDDGPGIPAEFHERVFVLFQRLSVRDDEGAESGTGMGLAICRRIIERHGGTIWIDPAHDGPGTRFRFLLPCDPQEPEPEGAMER